VGKSDKSSFKGKMWKLMKKIFCGQAEIKKTQKEILKTQKRILRRQEYTMEHVASQSGRPYVSEDEQEEEESEEEEEISGDSEGEIQEEDE
jgi:ribonuclease PH